MPCHPTSPSMGCQWLANPSFCGEGSGGSAVAHMGGSGCGCLRSSCNSTSCSTAQEDDRGHTITHMRALVARWRAADTSPSTSNHVIPSAWPMHALTPFPPFFPPLPTSHTPEHDASPRSGDDPCDCCVGGRPRLHTVLELRCEHRKRCVALSPPCLSCGRR
jgi:hypothetical protein